MISGGGDIYWAMPLCAFPVGGGAASQWDVTLLLLRRGFCGVVATVAAAAGFCRSHLGASRMTYSRVPWAAGRDVGKLQCLCGMPGLGCVDFGGWRGGPWELVPACDLPRVFAVSSHHDCPADSVIMWIVWGVWIAVGGWWQGCLV